MTILGSKLAVDTRQVTQAFVTSSPLINGLAIRDTMAHDITTDATINYLDCTHMPGPKMIWYSNTLNQAVTVQLYVSPDALNFVLVGTAQSLASGASGFIDNGMYGLKNSYPYMGVQVKCGSSPASGSLSISLLASSGPSVAGSSDVASAGAVAGAGTPPTTTNVGADTAYTFNTQVNHILIQNNTTANMHFDLDVASSLGSQILAPGSTFLADMQVTTLHLYTAAAQNINGTVSGNIVVRGWL